MWYHKNLPWTNHGLRRFHKPRTSGQNRKPATPFYRAIPTWGDSDWGCLFFVSKPTSASSRNLYSSNKISRRRKTYLVKYNQNGFRRTQAKNRLLFQQAGSDPRRGFPRVPGRSQDCGQAGSRRRGGDTIPCFPLLTAAFREAPCPGRRFPSSEGEHEAGRAQLFRTRLWPTGLSSHLQHQNHSFHLALKDTG